MDKLDADSNSSNQIDDDDGYPPPRRPRTSEDFYLFCTIILEHENYETLNHNENLRITNESPMNSGGDSVKSESEVASSDSITEYKTASESSDESIDGGNEEEAEEVTCYCGKPFAARPMIECSRCLTWIHLTCAKVKRTNIPDVFYCYKCKAKKTIIQQQRQQLHQHQQQQQQQQQHHHQQNHKLYLQQRERGDNERERDAKRPHLQQQQTHHHHQQQHNIDDSDDSENILSQTVTVVLPQQQQSSTKLQQTHIQTQISPINNQTITINNKNNKENNIIGVTDVSGNVVANGNKLHQQQQQQQHHNHHYNGNKISHKNLTNHKRL